MNTIDYYPGGMLMPGRSYSSNAYRFGYQGSIKDDEISGSGNNYSTFFRELDVRTLRWWGCDPKGTAGESPYVSMGNNPIWLNDILGDSAWSIKNKWNSMFEKKFRDFSAKKTEEYQKNNSKFSCEDFAISLAIDFASQNNLPFRFTNETGTFDPTDDVYTNTDQYKNAVLKSSGANDLANPKNTSPTSLKNAQPGDMILLKLNNKSDKYNHTQVITKVTAAQVDIHQGNLSYRILSQNPSNLFYGGKPIEEGSYYKGPNSYYNKTTKTYYPGGFLEKSKATVRTWNFYNWN